MAKLIEFTVPEKLHALLANIGNDFGLSASGIARHIVFDTLIKGGIKVAAEAEEEPEEEVAPEPQKPAQARIEIREESQALLQMIAKGTIAYETYYGTIYDLRSDKFKKLFDANDPLPPAQYALAIPFHNDIAFCDDLDRLRKHAESQRG